MRCSDYQERIELYLDEELPSSEGTEFESHAQACPSCREGLGQARMLRRALQEMPMPACPASAVDRVLRRTGIDQPKPVARRMLGQVLPHFSRVLLPRPAMVAWLLLMLVVSGAFYVSTRSWRFEPESYTVAELQQTKAHIDYAFGFFFRAVKKSEEFTRNEVLLSKVVLPVQAGLRRVYQPSSAKGAL